MYINLPFCNYIQTNMNNGYPNLKPNSWSYNFVEISEHNLESSQTWGFRIQCLRVHYKPVSNNFCSRGRRELDPLVPSTVEGEKQGGKLLDFCPNYVQEFDLDYWTECEGRREAQPLSKWAPPSIKWKQISCPQRSPLGVGCTVGLAPDALAHIGLWVRNTRAQRLRSIIDKIWSFISKVYLGSCVQLYSSVETPQPPPPHIWAHIRWRYWSAKIDNISL